MHQRAVAVSGALEELSRLFRRLSPVGGLSLTAAATLANLDRNGPQRITELAAREGVTQPGMTQLATRLEDAGFAERVADPLDGRVVRVRITDAGRAELDHRRSVRTERLADLLGRLSAEDQDALVAALPAITQLSRQLAGAVAV